MHVKFECGAENAILEVTEPEKCEYRYKMTSPAVCPLPEEAADNSSSKKSSVEGTAKAGYRHEEL